MFLIVGLGNPGRKYKKTPHNAGFIVLDKLQDKFEAPKFSENKKLKAELSKTPDFLLAKPDTFMNESGQAVSALMSYYKIDIKDLIVIHDDADINAGEIKIATDSRAAGHNGVESIIQHLGTKEFTRIRIGIKIEGLKKMPLEKFVLQKLNRKNYKLVEEGVDKAVNEVLDMLGS